MTKNEFENLLKKVRIASGKEDQEISLDMGYNKGYISQLKSRGKFPIKFIASMKTKYLKENSPQEPTEDYNVGIAIKKIEASNEVILSAIGELLAKESGQSVTVVQEQLETLVKKRLNSSGPSQ